MIRSKYRQAMPDEDLTGKEMILTMRPYESVCKVCGHTRGTTGKRTTHFRDEPCPPVRVIVFQKIDRIACSECDARELVEGYCGCVMKDNKSVRAGAPYTLLYHPNEDEEDEQFRIENIQEPNEDEPITKVVNK